MQADNPAAHIASRHPGDSLSARAYQWLLRGTSAWSHALQKRRLQAQRRAELQSLEPRELADLGIGRGETDYWLAETQAGPRAPR